MVIIQREGTLVRMEIDMLSNVEDMQEFIDEFEKLLALPEPFALLFYSDMSEQEMKSAKRSKDANKMHRAWTKANRARMAERCLAIAMVMKPSAMMRAMKPMASMNIKRTMGVHEGQMFFEHAKAELWLQEKIAQAALAQRG